MSSHIFPGDQPSQFAFSMPTLSRKFTQINLTLIKSTRSQLTSDTTLLKSKIALLQSKFEQITKMCSRDKQLLKSKFQELTDKLSSMTASQKERQSRSRLKLLSLKLKMERELAKHRYTVEANLKELKSENDRIMKILQQKKAIQLSKISNQVRTQGRQKSPVSESKSKLTLPLSYKHSIALLQSKIDSLKNELKACDKESEVEEVLIAFQHKIVAWRTELQDAEVAGKKLRSGLQTQIEITQNEIKSGLQEEQRARQQTKQKLLTLLQSAELPNVSKVN